MPDNSSRDRYTAGMISDEKKANVPSDSPQRQKREQEQTAGVEKDMEKPPLTPEEQMAQYEEALKESDWGHQPC